MLQPACLIPGLINTIRFSDDLSFVRLLDADATILLNLRISVPDGQIFINDQIDEAWGQRVSIDLPARDNPEFLTLHFKLADHLEFWNSRKVTVFERFTKATGEKVRYCLFKNASNPGDSLASPLKRPADVATAIATQVALRRADQLEKKLDALLNIPAEGQSSS